MDAVEFFKTANRLCKNQRCCKECPIHKKNDDMRCIIRVDDDSIKSIDETVSKVEQWAKDNTVKTRQSEFLKMFPNAVIDEDDGILGINPCAIDESIGCTDGKGCDGCRRIYWLTEVTDDD